MRPGSARAVVASGSLTTTTTYTYEGLTLHSLSAERSDTATWSLEYLYDGEGRPYAAIYAASDAAPVLTGIVTTLRGDVAGLTDASGAVFALYRYEAFGAHAEAASAATGSIPATLAAAITARNPLRYAGYCFDEHSGLYYCSARYYDPATRQFISKDPARADGEASAYQYCGGDPVGKVDPSGLWWWTVYAIHRVTRFEAWRDRVWTGGSAVAQALMWNLGERIPAIGPSMKIGKLVKWAGLLKTGSEAWKSFEGALNQDDYLHWERSSHAFPNPSFQHHGSYSHSFRVRMVVRRKKPSGSSSVWYDAGVLAKPRQYCGMSTSVWGRIVYVPRRGLPRWV